jgi:hypothetical protein
MACKRQRFATGKCYGESAGFRSTMRLWTSSGRTHDPLAMQKVVGSKSHHPALLFFPSSIFPIILFSTVPLEVAPGRHA